MILKYDRERLIFVMFGRHVLMFDAHLVFFNRAIGGVSLGVMDPSIIYEKTSLQCTES